MATASVAAKGRIKDIVFEWEGKDKNGKVVRGEVRSGGERIAELGAGDFFGEIALLEGGTRTATVVATTPLRLIVMSAHEFRRMEQDLPAIADRVRAAVRARLSD